MANEFPEATARPWAIYDYEGQVPKYPKNIIVAPTGESIAEIEGGWPQCTLTENEANAAFIVTAVNSYDALQAELKELREAAEGALELFGKITPDYHRHFHAASLITDCGMPMCKTVIAALNQLRAALQQQPEETK